VWRCAGKLLLSAALLALGLSTCLACVWPKGSLDDVPVEGLTLSDYKLWPLWIWIYCVICWFIQVRGGSPQQLA
jgi:H+-transporting ATPase